MGAAVASSADPWFVNQLITPNEARYALAALLARSPTDPLASEAGVLPGGSGDPFTATSTGTAGAPKATVSPGFAVVAAAGGAYICTWPASVQVPLTAPSGSPRIDTLCAVVQDTDVDGSGQRRFVLQTVDGTPAASPVAPALPAGFLPLRDILVATSGALTISDRRTFTRGSGGIRVVSAAAADLARPGSYIGDLRVRSTTPIGQIDVWLGSAWQTLASPAAWQQFTPELYYDGNGSGAGGSNTAPGTVTWSNGNSRIGRYLVQGKTCHLRYIFRTGTDNIVNSGVGYLSSRLPPNLVSAAAEETQILCKLNTRGGATSIWPGICFVPPNDTTLIPFFPFSQTDCRLTSYIVANAPAAAGTGFPRIAGSYPDPLLLVLQGSIEIQ